MSGTALLFRPPTLHLRPRPIFYFLLYRIHYMFFLRKSTTLLYRLLPLAVLALSVVACETKPDPPALVSLTPEKGSEGQLIIMRGENLAEIREMTFNDEVIPFNTAYNSDVALLFRVPTGLSLGEKLVRVRTDGGSFETNFLVTQEPPGISRFSPRSADAGEQITIIGRNFYEPPLTVWFRTDGTGDNGRQDSIAGEIVFAALDSLIVTVPENARTGKIFVEANGGLAESNLTFQTLVRTLVTDFDGNGVRPDNDAITFDGFTDQQNGENYIRRSLPGPIDENFLHLTGTDDLGTIWLGGAKTPGGNGVESFGITTDVRNTFLELDVNNNGRTNSWLTLVLQEKGDNSGLDYTVRRRISEPGWQRISIPLIRFRNSSNIIIDPALVNQIKWHIEDRDDTNQLIEMNIDNVEFVERL